MALHVGDVGKVIRVRHVDDQEPPNPVNLTNATNIRFRIQRTSGSSYDKTATPTGTPTDGYGESPTALGDLTEAGTYTLQSQVTFSDGDVIHSTKVTFQVEDVL